jgi:hypothetical protein
MMLVDDFLAKFEGNVHRLSAAQRTEIERAFRFAAGVDIGAVWAELDGKVLAAARAGGYDRKRYSVPDVRNIIKAHEAAAKAAGRRGKADCRRCQNSGLMTVIGSVGWG